MKLQVLQDEHFSCRSCTTCCRSWYVELIPGEAEAIAALGWPAGDPLAGVQPIIRQGGKTMLGRRADGACLFLNEANGLCRIHEQFGVDAKPLGCRIFPFQIAPTFKGEASIIGRFDCPTVRANSGASHADALPELQRLSPRLGISSGFDEATCCNLDREQIQAVCEFISTMLPGFETDAQRALFIAYLCDVLAATQVDELDRAALANIFPRLKQLVIATTSEPKKNPGWFARLSFRTLLGLYMRRDEDVLAGRAGRSGRMLALIRIILGFGDFQSLGISHHKGKLRKARLFKSSFAPKDPVTFAIFWRMIRNRLDSFQFMGPANSDRHFLDGLRSLALLYPLTVAVAKSSAANRGASSIDPEDVDYAVTAVEHSFGRLPILNQATTRSLETLLLNPKMFPRLVMTV